MSVVSFPLKYDGREGTETWSQGQYARRYTRIWVATTDNESDGESVIKSHASCPRIGDAFSGDIYARCIGVAPRQDPNNRKVWTVTATFSTLEGDIANNPLADPANIEWSTEQFQRVYYKDRDGDPIINKAGDYYNPPIMGDDSRVVAVVQKNVSGVPYWIWEYKNAVNSAAFTIDGRTANAGKAKMMSISLSGKQERNGVLFRVLMLQIAFDDDGWARELPNVGFRQKVGSERKDILDPDTKQRVAQPVPLDSSGATITDPSTSNVVTLTFNIYKEKNFGVLPLS